MIAIFLCFGILLFCGQSLASDTKVNLCNCYDTPTVGVEDFVDENSNSINAITTSCKDNFFVTSMTQAPEQDPKESGQFLIISSIRCCQLCTN